MGVPGRVLMQPENAPKKYEALFLEIDNGQTKIPMFQRDFVWEKDRTSKFIDSILKGYPVGAFVFWKTREELRSYRNIGNHKLKQIPKGDYAQYVLDGQQRITSLYAVRKGIRITRQDKEIDYKDIYIDLEFDEEHDDQIVVAGKPIRMEGEKEIPKRSISVHRVLTCSFIDLEDEYSKEDRKKINEYHRTLTGYDFATIVISDYPVEIACEIFTRINTGGESLSMFEIMVAKTYDEPKKFDLYERYVDLRDGTDDDEEEDACLRGAHFETIPETAVMQCVTAIATRQIRSRDILKIKRDVFIDHWEPMRNSLFHAIDFVRSHLRIQASQLLPYPSIVVPITYFFYKTKNKRPTNAQRILLEQWFYWVGLNFRYSSGTETKLVEDMDRMDAILKGEAVQYPKSEMNLDWEDLAEWRFSAGDAQCKSILCLLASLQPRSFDSDSLVILDNSNLRNASSKNFHHFFPKKYLEQSDGKAQPNLMANITLIDGYSNKHRIGKKAPSIYIGKFSRENDGVEDALKTHLILDIQRFGIADDNYGVFIQERSKAIARAINRKLQPKTE